MTQFEKMYSQNDGILYWSLLHGKAKMQSGWRRRVNTIASRDGMGGPMLLAASG